MAGQVQHAGECYAAGRADVSRGAGGNFGWPYCYFDYAQQKLLLNPEYGGDGKTVGRCSAFTLPVMSYPAHWAPGGR